MNKPLLALTYSNAMSWLTKCREETVPIDKKLEIVLLCIADLCLALGTDGTAESREEFEKLQP